MCVCVCVIVYIYWIYTVYVYGRGNNGDLLISASGDDTKPAGLERKKFICEWASKEAAINIKYSTSIIYLLCSYAKQTYEQGGYSPIAKLKRQ